MKTAPLSEPPPRAASKLSRLPSFSKEDRSLPLIQLKTILVPIDFSPPSMRAMDHAVVLARKFGATVHLVHVQSPDEACVVAGAGHLMRECAKTVAFVQKTLANKGPDDSVDFWPPNCHLRTGQAYHEVVEVAREIGADLIVLATRGHTGFKRLLLGSTAERIVRFSPCPVLIIRPRRKVAARKESARPLVGFEIRHILVPVDFSTASMAALKFAASLARKFDARIHLFHALFPATRVTLDRVSVETIDESAGAFKRDAEMNMEALTQLDFMRGLKCETEVRWGYAIEEICGISSRPEMDLLVTSTHGRSGFKHILIGSVAEHVVRYAECPVLVVPAVGVAANDD